MRQVLSALNLASWAWSFHHLPACWWVCITVQLGWLGLLITCLCTAILLVSGDVSSAGIQWRHQSQTKAFHL